MEENKFIDATLMNKAREDLEIKRVRVSESLVHETQTYLFQEFGDKYARLLQAYNESADVKVSADPQDILRMKSAELILYLLLSRNRDRDTVQRVYKTQFNNASPSKVAKFMALYDATQETESALISNQLLRMTDELKKINTNTKKTQEDARDTATGVEIANNILGFLTADRFGKVTSYNIDNLLEQLNKDEVKEVSKTLIDYGNQLADQKRRTKARGLRGGNL